MVAVVAAESGAAVQGPAWDPWCDGHVGACIRAFAFRDVLCFPEDASGLLLFVMFYAFPVFAFPFYAFPFRSFPLNLGAYKPI